ncbi:MAG TPA: histidine kinase dimerization/phospho-acceptor domain-containing protein [Gaiellaceae bacterium]|nr:histidine kinase dimerization/phospho-acceptor domain-containing protein [Gaiellaceae bacterium]
MRRSVSTLLSTLLDLPDGRRAAVERELVPLARAAALGEIAADVAHDVANPLFGAIGIVDLLRDDATPGQTERLELLADTTAEMKRTLDVLIDFARLAGDTAERASLDDAVRSALRLLRHGGGRMLRVEERYPDAPVQVDCPPGLLVQAMLQLLLAARSARGLEVAVEETSVRIAPAPPDTLGVRIAERIVRDRGATVERSADAIAVRF